MISGGLKMIRLTRKEKACLKIIDKYKAYTKRGYGDKWHLTVIDKIDRVNKTLVLKERLQAIEDSYFLPTSEIVSYDFSFEDFYNMVKDYEIVPIYTKQAFANLQIKQNDKMLRYFKFRGRFYEFIRPTITKNYGIENTLGFTTTFLVLDLVSGENKTFVNIQYDNVGKDDIVISGTNDIVWYKDKNDMIIEMLGKMLEK